jgi:hypothetical protein
VRAALDAGIPGHQLPAGRQRRGEGLGRAGARGVLAVLLSASAILIYIWLRFEWQFALGRGDRAGARRRADDRDLQPAADRVQPVDHRGDPDHRSAIRLNDTVVVFDRVRENLRKFKKMPLIEVLNLSVNETLSRTVMTSVTTLIALVALYVLGGEVVRGFTFAMIWGVLIGTYSSIFVAAAGSALARREARLVEAGAGAAGAVRRDV